MSLKGILSELKSVSFFGFGVFFSFLLGVAAFDHIAMAFGDGFTWTYKAWYFDWGLKAAMVAMGLCLVWIFLKSFFASSFWRKARKPLLLLSIVVVIGVGVAKPHLLMELLAVLILGSVVIFAGYLAVRVAKEPEPFKTEAELEWERKRKEEAQRGYEDIMDDINERQGGSRLNEERRKALNPFNPFKW